MKQRYTDLFRSLLLAPCMALLGPLAAQPYYTFEQDAAPYAEITDGTPLALADGWGRVTALNGETFPVTGGSFTFGGARELWVGESGFINIDFAPVNTLFLSALFAVQGGFTGLQPIDGTSSVTYKLEGGTGDLHVVIQWKNYRRYDGGSGDFLNFQVHLYQATGVMELRYGPFADGDPGYTTANGPNAGYYFADYSASTIYDRLWLNGDPAAPGLSGALVASFTGMTAIPADGTVYRFTPAWGVGIAEAMQGDASFSATWDANARSIRIAFAQADPGTLIVRDAAGRVVRTERTASDRLDLPFEGSSAVYVLEHISDQGLHRVRRVVTTD